MCCRGPRLPPPTPPPPPLLLTPPAALPLQVRHAEVHAAATSSGFTDRGSALQALRPRRGQLVSVALFLPDAALEFEEEEEGEGRAGSEDGGEREDVRRKGEGGRLRFLQARDRVTHRLGVRQGVALRRQQQQERSGSSSGGGLAAPVAQSHFAWTGEDVPVNFRLRVRRDAAPGAHAVVVKVVSGLSVVVFRAFIAVGDPRASLARAVATAARLQQGGGAGSPLLSPSSQALGTAPLPSPCDPAVWEGPPEDFARSIVATWREGMSPGKHHLHRGGGGGGAEEGSAASFCAAQVRFDDGGAVRRAPIPRGYAPRPPLRRCPTRTTACPPSRAPR